MQTDNEGNRQLTIVMGRATKVDVLDSSGNLYSAIVSSTADIQTGNEGVGNTHGLSASLGCCSFDCRRLLAENRKD